MSDLSTRVLVSIGLVVLAVGALDAFIGRQWDLLVVIGFAATIQLVVWFRQHASRVPVTLRPDLAQWLERQSQRRGEPVDDVLDRAVAWYQHGLFRPAASDETSAAQR